MVESEEVIAGAAMVILAWYQSNEKGVGAEFQPLTLEEGAAMPAMLRYGEFSDLSDPVGTVTSPPSLGSTWPRIASHFANRGIFVCVVNVAVGSTNIEQWVKSANDLYPRIESAAAYTKGFEISYCLGGEGNTAGTSQETMFSRMNTMVNDLFTDYGIPTYITNYPGQAPGVMPKRKNIDDAYAQVVASNPNAFFGGDLRAIDIVHDNSGDNVHLDTDEQLTRAADIRFNAWLESQGLAPVVDAGADQVSVVAGSTVILDGTGSFDPNGLPLTYQWTQTRTPDSSTITINNPNSPVASVVIPSSTVDRLLCFNLVVSNGAQSSSSRSVYIEALSGDATENQPPVANAGPDQTVAAGVLVQVSASATSDGDGTIVGYKWRETTNSGITLSSTTSENISFTSPVSDTAQTVTLELIVTDDDGVDSAPVYVNFNVAAEVDTTPPVIILQGGNISLQVGETFQEPGYQAFNNKGVDITSEVTVTGSTSTAFPRTGTLEYNVVADGIAAETQTRIFTVTAESELLEAVSKQKFLRDNTVISAFTGRSNIEELKFKLASTNTKIALDNQGYYDFDENETQKVIVVSDDGEISSDNGDVEWEGSSLFVRFGAFSSRKSQLSARVVVFLAGDERGVVIAGPGLNANLLIKFN